MATPRVDARLLARAIGLLLIGIVFATLLSAEEAQVRTLKGEFTIFESQVARFDREVHDALARPTPDPLESDLGLCLRLSKALDVAAGQAVVVYNEAGFVIGQRLVGHPASVNVARREPDDAFTICRMRFRVDEIRPSRTMTIVVGDRRTTLRATELEANGWNLEIPVGL
jgi:hypothetical protein